MNTAKKNPLTMTLGELLKEYGGPRKQSGTQLRVEEALPTPPPSRELSAKTVTIGGERFLRLKEPSFNYRFVRGFIPYRVSTMGHVWKWDAESKTRLVPIADLDLLMEGLKECYAGETLVVDGKSVKL